MARKRTKKQKKKARVKTPPVISVLNTGQVSIKLDDSKSKIKKTKSITFSQSQVSLLRKDLLKTLITTLIVFGILFLTYLSLK